LTLSRKACGYSRIVAYCLILTSALALFNASVQTVSSQTFDTPASTDSSTKTVQTTTTTNATQLPATSTDSSTKTVQATTATNTARLLSTSTETTKTTTTATSTATLYTIAYVTSNMYVTVFQIQYTTANNFYTIVKVQFTTLTSSITQVDSPQPIGAPSLPVHSTSGPPIVSDALLGHIDVGLTLQLIASLILIILLASIPLIRRERK
jgi:hypothetical protein